VQQTYRRDQNASRGDWDGPGSGGKLQAKHNKVSTLPPSLSDPQGDSKPRAAMREQGQQAIQPFGSTTEGRFNYEGSV
jgi:hypothetical protein